ncbi:low molecular weight phosphatase family protein [Microbacterium jejuense]|uniref:protein-tyrosine-phosphatase n=1 Tax=Microbacterium jejuense TaxID=1263637 RepID=A0ABS7HMG4_9MICO|nr:low molecular weight phosphatase family protein [Microbacterium jejuense]MBW9094156.1 low molecular weight phosphatase family protein [Microbacterium jejuense]
MFEILTVCTGNICRSPLAEILLRARLADLAPRVASAGTRGLASAPMTPEAAHLALALGAPEAETLAHRSRFLTEQHLESPDLILAMTRDHRRAIVGLAPSRLRSTFTVREFARLASAVSADELRRAADAAGPEPAARIRAASQFLAASRGLVPTPQDPADDDVVDPYGQPWETYLVSTSQLEPAVSTTASTLRLVLS